MADVDHLAEAQRQLGAWRDIRADEEALQASFAHALIALVQEVRALRESVATMAELQDRADRLSRS